MGDEREVDPLNTVSEFSGSTNTFRSYCDEVEKFQPPRWERGIAYRTFELGDLVTLSPEFRYAIAISRPDFGRYIGIVVEAYANREYVVHWTAQPLINSPERSMFNGDHLILVEHAEKASMKKII
jgi:hypothetical protein